MQEGARCPPGPPVLQPSWREEPYNTDLTKDCVFCTKKSGTSVTAEQTTNLNYRQKM